MGGIQKLIYAKDQLEFIFYNYEKLILYPSSGFSLTYLRGLEITDLKEEDMPMI